MAGHSAYRAVHAPHVEDAGLCAGCHVLTTSHGHGEFTEQATWLEWQNSAYAMPDSAERRTCQQCHMPKQAATAIDRRALSFPVQVAIRPEVWSHATVGGNAFLLDLMAEHADDLGLAAPPETLRRVAGATRRQLATETARVTVENSRDEDGRVLFDVVVENLTGHKFPSGYPSRRAIVHVRVVDRFGTLFESGAVEPGFGTLRRVEDPFAIPHRDVISNGAEVVVYEMVAEDEDGVATTVLSRMAGVRKDNRLLPRGWRADGPDGDRTRPIGVEGDDDFIAGRDTVTYSFQRPPSSGPFRVVAELLYHPIPPAWVAGLEDSETAEADRFRSMYYGADPAPEVVAVDQLVIP